MDRARLADRAVAAALTAWMLAEVWVEHLRPAWIATAGFVVVGVALATRRSRPILVGATFVAVMIVQAAAGVTLHSAVAPVVAALLASWTIGVREPRQRALLGLTILICGLWVAMGVDMLRGTDDYEGTDFPWIGTILAAPGIFGIVFGSRALRFELERKAAVAEERARIARELHDVIAHSVAVMTVQAGAAEAMLARDPARALEPVRAVQQTGRDALVEMKRLVGLLREDDQSSLAPQPGLAQVEGLLADVREAGVAVELRIVGEPRPLPPGVELSAYRIVQEALTNVLKHADCGRVVVEIGYRGDGVDLEVLDDGRAAEATGRGHGLVGMRERVAIFGGSLEAGAVASGGFRVRARLPAVTPA